jgi:hypothetical protein
MKGKGHKDQPRPDIEVTLFKSHEQNRGFPYSSVQLGGSEVSEIKRRNS